MSDKCFEFGRIYTPDGFLEKSYLTVSETKIEEISSTRPSFVGEEIYDFSNEMAVPGFIDIHTHGFGGASATSGSEMDFLKMSKHFGSMGVTSFLPTVWSASENRLKEVCSSFSDACLKEGEGSEMLGLHLEGPYFGKGEERGAQNSEFLRPPDIEEFERLAETSGDRIERISLAPDLDGALEFIEKVSDKGVLVSAGHTAIDYEGALESFDRGVSLVTHLFNGMGSFHHRRPGIVGASLSTDVYTEIIMDMLHVHPAVVEMAIRAKGVDRVVAITDSVSLAGLPDGVYDIGGQKVKLSGGECRTLDTNRLAGSTLTMSEAVKNIVKYTSFGLEEAIKMASTVPADVFSLRDRGRIEPGLRADMAILNKELEVVGTVVGGELMENKSSLVRN
ncbi:MAG: N-acetylglucosamine-6-phosphate deacetylase [Candidatus Hadarchaeota archaeon]